MVAINCLDDEHLGWRKDRKFELCPELFYGQIATVSFFECSTNLGHTHLVGGEGTSLVRADDRGAAQGLHRGQASDNGVLLGHTAGTKGKAGGDDSGQT